jgi:two-component system response regulator DesR
VIVLTTSGRAGYLKRALESGAGASIEQEAPASQLARVYDGRAMNSERVVDPGLAAALSEGNNSLTGP